MYFSLDYLVSYLSYFVNIHLGDIIAISAVAEIGMAMTPPFHELGDSVEFWVEGIGSISNGSSMRITQLTERDRFI